MLAGARSDRVSSGRHDRTASRRRGYSRCGRSSRPRSTLRWRGSNGASFLAAALGLVAGPLCLLRRARSSARCDLAQPAWALAALGRRVGASPCRCSRGSRGATTASPAGAGRPHFRRTGANERIAVDAAVWRLAAIVALAIVTWLVSLYKRDVSIVDSMWSVMICRARHACMRQRCRAGAARRWLLALADAVGGAPGGLHHVAQLGRGRRPPLPGDPRAQRARTSR